MKKQLVNHSFWIKRNIKSIITFFALMTSIIGTYIIWIDSQNTINSLAELLRETTATVGFWQDEPISQERIKRFNQSLQNAANLDKKGFVLLMSGFGLQIINLFITKQNANTEV